MALFGLSAMPTRERLGLRVSPLREIPSHNHLLPSRHDCCRIPRVVVFPLSFLPIDALTSRHPDAVRMPQTLYHRKRKMIIVSQLERKRNRPHDQPIEVDDDAPISPSQRLRLDETAITGDAKFILPSIVVDEP